MTPIAGADGRSQPEIAMDGIKSMIVSGELQPGSRLPVENDLAKRLGVSRGPLREGVRALVVLGVIETRQGDGSYVTSLDPERLMSPLGVLSELQTAATAPQLLDLRRILEAESAARAAVRLGPDALDGLRGLLDGVEPIVEKETHDGDDLDAFIDSDSAFHRRIAEAAENPALAALIDSLIGRTERARLWRAVSDRGAVRATQTEHRAILAELERHDPDRARVRMQVHLLGVEQFAVEHPRSPEAPDADADA